MEKILTDHALEIPDGLTKHFMLRKSFDGKSSQTLLTGRQIWETLWTSMNCYITNVMLVKWMEVRPMTKDGKVKSGVENFEPALLDLRKKLFDLEKNSIPLIIESSPNQEIHANNSIGVLFEDVRKPEISLLRCRMILLMNPIVVTMLLNVVTLVWEEAHKGRKDVKKNEIKL